VRRKAIAKVSIAPIKRQEMALRTDLRCDFLVEVVVIG
jgi:hypothetical protein